MKKLVSIVILLVVAWPLRGGDADLSLQAVSRFLDEFTYAVVRVQVGEVDIEAIGARLAQLGVPEEGVANFKKMAGPIKDKIAGAGCKEAFAVWSLADRLGEPFLVLPVKDENKAQFLATFLKETKLLYSETVGATVLAGSPKALQRLRQAKGKPNADLARALAATQKATIQGAFFRPAVLRRSLREAFPRLPRELGGGPTADLDQGFRWAAGGLRIAPKFSLELIVQAKDADAARDLNGFVERLLDFAGLQKDIQEAFPDFAKIQRLLTPEVKDDRLVLAIDDKAFQQVIKPVALRVHESAQRAVSMNNLKQIALAMYNYLDARKSFIASASYDPQGKPLLSWRVHLLPFLEQDQLYKEFRLDEPWDSAHNKKLIERMPALYRSPAQKNADPGKTSYLVPVGKSTIFPGPKGIRFPKDIPDGTSNTIMVVEANDQNAAIWTKPEDFSVKAKDADLLDRLVRPGARGFNTAFADGAARFISRTINLKDLHALFTRNGGEVIGNIP